MLEKTFILTYLEKSLMLDNSSIATDQAYIDIKAELPNIYKMAIIAHNADYTEDTIPDKEVPFAIIKAKIEIYYRLATVTAPFYPIEADGAKLSKNTRFDHYMSLLRRVSTEYETNWEHFEHNQEVQIVNVMLQKYHYTRRNYNEAKVPQVTVTIVSSGETTLDVSWTQFNAQGGLFYGYKVYVSQNPIYDEFEGLIDPRASLVCDYYDIHRTKCRIKGLTPSTAYHVLVVSEERNGLKGYSEVSTTTATVTP